MGGSHLESRIFVGKVMHARKTPIKHQFVYDVFMMYLELGKRTPEILKRFWLWSSNDAQSCLVPPIIARYRASDHLSDDAVKQLISERLSANAASAISRVFLLTNFRYFGFVFNPISIYFCFDSAGEMMYIVDEVTNTPWGERIHYVHRTTDRDGKYFLMRYAKGMHVSPFFGMHYGYVTKYTLPAGTFSLQIELENTQSEQIDLIARLDLTAYDLTQRNLLWVLWKFPAMTAKVVWGIYYQALKLWWKGAPFYSHPSKDSSQQIQNASAAKSDGPLISKAGEENALLSASSTPVTSDKEL